MKYIVIPAKAGIYCEAASFAYTKKGFWIPAFAGMTGEFYG